MADIYDGVFRTVLNDCRKFILPLLNEVFGETYDGTETVEFYPNEHFLDQPGAPDEKRITDASLRVVKSGALLGKYHLECESSRFSSEILIRLFEYDAQIALDEGEVGKDSIRVSFPNTAVLFLRDTQNTPDYMRVVIEIPGGSIEYQVPAVRLAQYSLEEMLEKRLYVLIPFYIFNCEKKFKEYNEDGEKLEELKEEYRGLLERLRALTEREEMSAFDCRTLIELSMDVVNELTRKYENLQRGVGDLMRGAIIETEARRIRNEGIRLGITEGEARGEERERIHLILNMYEEGGSLDFIARVVKKPREEVEEIIHYNAHSL